MTAAFPYPFQGFLADLVSFRMITARLNVVPVFPLVCLKVPDKIPFNPDGFRFRFTGAKNPVFDVTHIPSIDLLPLFTCHGRCHELCGKVPDGKVLPPCYAAKFANRLPDVMRNYAENTVLAIHRPVQYWKEINDKMHGCRFMRLFTSGDMIINGYFENLCRCLENNPHCEVQGFTKCYEIVNRYIDSHGKTPDNLHLLFSGWYEYMPVNPHGLPESRVYDHELPDGWLSCGGNCLNCACIGLGCWKAENGDIVGLKRH